MSNREWRPVVGYDGIYEVSSYGELKSLARTVNLVNGKKRKTTEKLLVPKRNADGYLFVALSKNGLVRSQYIHRIVAAAFIPNPWCLPECNHLDGVKTNNCVGNLQWCSHQQNVQHAYTTGLSSNKGGSHIFAVGVIEMGIKFDTLKEWAEYRRITYSTARNLLNGRYRSKTIDLTGVVKISKTNDKY